MTMNPILKVLRGAAALLALSVPLVLSACGDEGKEAAPKSSSSGTFLIYSGSENKPLEPFLMEAAKAAGADVRIQYLGSVDIASALRSGKAVPADAVWPASHSWIDVGDASKVVKDAKSVMRSPVVMGVRMAKAKELGWTGGKSVSISEILKAAKSGKLRYGATSATQSNSGAAFYLAALHASAGNRDEPLQASDLDNPKVRAGVKELLGLASRSSGSSGWLGELYASDPDAMDAMVNYESVVWETNRKIVPAGREAMCAVYLSDATAIADSPFGYVDKGDSAKAALFKSLQDHLLSPEVQAQIRSMGRRTGAIGMEGDASVLAKDECFDVGKVLSPLPMPDADTTMKALGLYQTALRKPSATVYVLDFSGSMAGRREADLKAAMASILDPEQSAQALLQPSPQDIHHVVVFSDRILEEFGGKGDDPKVLSAILEQLRQRHADGGTDIYSAVALGMRRLGELGPKELETHFPAVILMTDGESNAGPGPQIIAETQRQMAAAGLPRIPVFAIAFGEADWRQLNALAKTTSGKAFDSKKGLLQAFREAKGYN